MLFIIFQYCCFRKPWTYALRSGPDPQESACRWSVATGSSRRWVQRIDATHALNRSAGVSYSSVFRSRCFSWRAVDQDNNVIDILVQKRRDKRAAKRFFRKMLKHQGQSPRRMVTDKLKSYSAAGKEVMPSVVHCQDRYANNRAEASHQQTRQQERQMRRFKSAGQAQRFLSVHSQVNNVFRVGRHLLKACHYRMFRSRAFSIWQEVTCV